MSGKLRQTVITNETVFEYFNICYCLLALERGQQELNCRENLETKRNRNQKCPASRYSPVVV